MGERFRLRTGDELWLGLPLRGDTELEEVFLDIAENGPPGCGAPPGVGIPPVLGNELLGEVA